MQKFCVLALGFVLLAGCTSSPTMAEEPAANNATAPAPTDTPEPTAPEAAPKDDKVMMPADGQTATASFPAPLTGEFKVIGTEAIMAAITQREGELTDADKKDAKFSTLREAYADAGMMISADATFVLNEPQNLKPALRKEGTLTLAGDKLTFKVTKVDGKEKSETMSGRVLPDGHIVLTLGGIETELTNHNH